MNSSPSSNSWKRIIIKRNSESNLEVISSIANRNLRKKQFLKCDYKNSKLNNYNDVSRSSPTDQERLSPDSKCPICLSKILEESFANRCLHSFCKICLFEWAKVKADCPVCRQPIERVISNVISISNFEEIDIKEILNNNFYSQLNRPRNVIEEQSMFRNVHSSDVTYNRRLAIERIVSLNGDVNYARNSNFTPGTVAHRRYIYHNDLFVKSYGDGDKRKVREASADFYHKNPACVQRLIKWLNLELVALIHNPPDRKILLSIIIRALQKYDIISSQFQRLIAPFTSHHTVHFIHEFYNFARSYHDLNCYYENAIYVPRVEANVVQIQDNENGLTSLIDQSSDLETAHSLSDSDIEIVYDDFSSSPLNVKKVVSNNSKDANNCKTDNEVFNPKPGPSGLNIRPTSSLKQIHQNYTDDSDSDDENYPPKNDLFNSSENFDELESDDDSIKIIGTLKPRHLRTPEIIELTEDEDSITAEENTDSSISDENYIEKSETNKLKSNISVKQPIPLQSIIVKPENLNLTNSSYSSLHSNHGSDDFFTHKTSRPHSPSTYLNYSTNGKRKCTSVDRLCRKINESASSSCTSSTSSFTHNIIQSIIDTSESPNDNIYKNLGQTNSRHNLSSGLTNRDDTKKVIKQINKAVNSTLNRLPSVIGSHSSTINKMNLNSFYANVETDDESS